MTRFVLACVGACLGCAVLAGCCNRSPDSSTDEPALAVADHIDTPEISEPGRPAPDDGYEVAPGGVYVHATCVFEVGDGDEIADDGSTITRADGAIIPVPACEHRAAERAGASARVEQDAPLELEGWIATAAGFPAGQADEYVAYWHVPAAPLRSAGQTIFVFDGTMDQGHWTELFQPVLAWGHSIAGGGPYWTIAAWRAVGGRYFHSRLERVHAGDTIEGHGERVSATTWAILAADRTTGATTMLTAHTRRAQTLSVGAALEVHHVHACDQLPRGRSITFWGEHWSRATSVAMSPALEYDFYSRSACGGIHARAGSAGRVVIDYGAAR